LVRRAAQRGKRFELRGDAIRARGAPRGQPPQRKEPSAGPPDILYHACTDEQVRQYLAEGALRVQGGARPLFLSDDETQAWRAAHRMTGERRGMTGERRGMTGERRGTTGEGRGMTGERPGTTGERPGTTGERPGTTGESRG